MSDIILLLLTSTGGASTGLNRVALPLEMVLTPMPFADALARGLPGARAVWASPIDEEDAASLAMIAAACGDRPLIVETPAALLDTVWHQLAEYAHAHILVTPGPVDIAAALMAVRRWPSSMVRDPGATNRRLVEEIRAGLEHYSRLLEQIVGGEDGGGEDGGWGHGTPGRAPSGQGGGEGGGGSGGAHVAAQARGYGAGPAQPAAPAQPPANKRATEIRTIQRQRRLRATLFGGELFADPAWDMLLDLYAATLEGRRLSVSSLCIAADVPHATAWRRLTAMIDRGLLQRALDPDDGRRSFVSFTAQGRALMDRFFDSVAEGR